MLRVEEAEQPVPSSGQVLIAVEVAGAVYGDTIVQVGAVAAGVLAAMRVRVGDAVLVTAAAGRVGSLLVQLAKRPGPE